MPDESEECSSQSGKNSYLHKSVKKIGLNRELNPGHVHLGHNHCGGLRLPKHVSYYWTIEPLIFNFLT